MNQPRARDILAELPQLNHTLERLRTMFHELNAPHVFIGGLAAFAYGQIRLTFDIDVCVCAADLPRACDHVRRRFRSMDGRQTRFVDDETQVTIDLIRAGKPVRSRDGESEIRFPHPADAVIGRGLPVPPLPRFVELLLALGRFKDLANVVELIRVNKLDESSAEQLHPVARSPYLQCYDQKLDEDRYSPER